NDVVEGIVRDVGTAGGIGALDVLQVHQGQTEPAQLLLDLHAVLRQCDALSNVIRPPRTRATARPGVRARLPRAAPCPGRPPRTRDARGSSSRGARWRRRRG